MENETEKIREKKKEYGEKIEYVLDGPWPTEHPGVRWVSGARTGLF
jgi:hypothetical protein